MKANLVFESLNEYISQAEDKWADEEINRWEIKKRGSDPFKEYTNKVVKGIYDSIPDDALRSTGLTPDMIHDIVTSPTDESGILSRDVYDYYEDHVPVDVAIIELGQQVENYIGVGGNDIG